MNKVIDLNHIRRSLIIKRKRLIKERVSGDPIRVAMRKIEYMVLAIKNNIPLETNL